MLFYSALFGTEHDFLETKKKRRTDYYYYYYHLLDIIAGHIHIYVRWKGGLEYLYPFFCCCYLLEIGSLDGFVLLTYCFACLLAYPSHPILEHSLVVGR